MSPEVEVVARNPQRLRVLQRCPLAARQLALLALQPQLAQDVADGADVAGLLGQEQLRVRPLQDLLQPVAGVVEAVALPLRLPHPVCWAESSWWPTREALNYC